MAPLTLAHALHRELPWRVRHSKLLRRVAWGVVALSFGVACPYLPAWVEPACRHAHEWVGFFGG